MQPRALRGAFVAATVLVLTLTMASPASAHVPQGTTWLSDGTTSGGVYQGHPISAYAVGARPGVPYILTIGRQNGDLDLCHGGTALNPTPVYAGSNGLIGTVTGNANVPARQTYEVAFCGQGTFGTFAYTRTSSVTVHVSVSGVDGGVS
jgi:hypothetical protein